MNLSVDNEIFSWHMPLVLSLNVTNSPEIGNTSTVCKTSKIIWNDDNVHEFTNVLTTSKTTCALESLKVSMGLDIDECISNYILLNASKCMLKNIYPNNHQT